MPRFNRLTGMKSALPFLVLICATLSAFAQTAPSEAENALSPVLYRGDARHTGVYPDSKAPAGKVKWSFTTGNKIRSTPAYCNGVVYFGSDDGFLYALDANSGKLKWKFRAAGAVSSSPAVYRNLVYIEAGDSTFHAVDAASGREKWKAQTGPPIPADPKIMSDGKWEYEHASPVIDGGTVYLGSADGNLYALEALSGRPRWKFKTSGRIRATAAVADGVIYLPSMDGNLYALETASGAQKWKFKTAGNQYFPRGDIQSSPAVNDGVVYFGSRDAGLYAVNVADGTLRWKKDQEDGSWVISGPAIYKDMVIIGTSDNHDLRAYDARSGDLKWKAASPSPANILASPIVSAGKLYVGDFYGSMMWLDAATGKLRGGFSTDGRIVSSAIIHEGVLFFGGEDEVFYAVE
jgi:outer membrane protein assembly factor BamB